MTTISAMTDDEFLKGFQECTIPHDQWSHRAHIRMAYLHLARDPFDLALPKVRAGILKLNAAQNTPEAIDRGYHETVTQAWLRIVAATMKHYGTTATSEEFCNQQPHLLARTLLRLFYSRGRIMSWEAKKGWVEPDLTPLPT